VVLADECIRETVAIDVAKVGVLNLPRPRLVNPNGFPTSNAGLVVLPVFGKKIV